MNPQIINLGSMLKDLKLGLQQGRPRRARNQATTKGMFPQLVRQGMKSMKGRPFPAEGRMIQGGSREVDWLHKFKDQLLSAGIPLKALSLSPQSQPALKDLLLAQGVSEDDIQPLLRSLFGGDGRQEVPITQVLTQLSQLKASTDEQSADPVLEVSVLPQVESLLRSLGLDVVETRKAMTLARMDGGGLSVKGLVEALKGIMSHMPEETKAAPINQEAGADVNDLLARLGAVDEASKINGPVSLERFVQLLEDKVAHLVSRRPFEGETENHMKRLLAQVLAEPGRQGRSSRIKALGEGKHYLFSVEGLKEESVSQNLTKGIKGMVARGAWKTSRMEGGKPSLAKGLETTVSSARAQTDESGQAGHKNGEFSLKAKDQMILGKRGALDQRVDQGSKAPLFGAGETVMDQPQEAGTGARQMPRPFPLHVINQVGRQMALAIRRGENQVRLQLKPPDLGSIQLDMVVKDHTLKVAMITEHHAVKELLMSHVQELREALVGQGVDLQRIDITTEQHFGQSLANAQRDLHDAQAWRSSLTSASGALAAGPDHTGEVIAPRVSNDALVDMFA